VERDATAESNAWLENLLLHQWNNSSSEVKGLDKKLFSQTLWRFKPNTEK